MEPNSRSYIDTERNSAGELDAMRCPACGEPMSQSRSALHPLWWLCKACDLYFAFNLDSKQGDSNGR